MSFLTIAALLFFFLLAPLPAFRGISLLKNTPRNALGRADTTHPQYKKAIAWLVAGCLTATGGLIFLLYAFRQGGLLG